MLCTLRGGSEIEMEAESRVKQPQAKKCWQPPEAEKVKGQGPLQGFQRECNPTDALISAQ